MKPLWPHQAEGLLFTLSRPSVMLGMDMGTGKTRVVIEVVKRSNKGSTTLIVCPKSVLPVWEKEFRKWYPGTVSKYVVADADLTIETLTDGDSAKKIIRMQECGHRRKALNEDAKLVFVVNFEIARTKIFAAYTKLIAWTTIVLDESHRIKAPTGTTAKALWDLRAGKKLCLTGTMMPHSPLDIWSQFRFLDPTIFGFSYTKFRMIYALFGLVVPEHFPQNWKDKLNSLPTPHRAHCTSLLGTKNFKSTLRSVLHRQLLHWLSGDSGTLLSPFSNEQWNALGTIDHKRLRAVVGYKNLPMLEAKMAQITFQVKADDVLDLPEKHHITKPIELDAKTRKVYRDMEKDLVAWVREGVNVTAANALDRLNKLHQATGGTMIVEDDVGSKELVVIGTDKRDALRDMLDDLPPEEPMIVFCLYRGDIESAHAAVKDAGRESFELSGRGNQLAEWQDDRSGSVLVAQIQSGGVGISLVRSRYCCYYSLGFSLGDYEQSLARVHRPGQARSVTYFHLVAPGTVDEKVYSALRRRKDVVSAVLAGVAEIVALSITTEN